MNAFAHQASTTPFKNQLETHIHLHQELTPALGPAANATHRNAPKRHTELVRAPASIQLPRGATRRSTITTSSSTGGSGATGRSLPGSWRSAGPAASVYTVPQGLQKRRGRDCRVSATGHVQGGERKGNPGVPAAVLSAGLLDWLDKRGNTRTRGTDMYCEGSTVAFCLLLAECNSGG